MKIRKYSSTIRTAIISVFMLLLFAGISNNSKAQNYGMRDDEGVNLPTVTYWHSGLESDVTEKGAQFNERDFGAITAFYFKGAAIKTWKAEGGDVTGAQFNYKVWKTTETEPENYTVRAVGWSTNDGGGNQTWSGFGEEIPLINNLTSGTYNLKILFTITGTGVPGITENGPFTATFQITQQSSAAEILSFEIENQIGESLIDSENATVLVRMVIGTTVTALQPAITVSDGATISPESDVYQDFTNSVIYTVTAEDQTEKVWTASVQLIEQPVYYSVTFNVDMTPAINGGYFNPSSDYVDVGGNYNEYSGSGAMTAGQNNIYTQTTNQIFEAGEELEFKFRINGDWQTAELLGQDNRQYIVISGENVYNAVYNQPGTTEPTITFANLQFPGTATIEIGETVDAFAQVEVTNTELNTETGYENLTVWIGISSEDSNPNTWTSWEQATYNGVSEFTQKPEYKVAIGGEITQAGTYYYASRYQLSSGDFYYGGFSETGGGFWNGGENVSGVLTVVEQIQYFPVTFTVTNNNPSVTLVKIKGAFNEWTHVDMENTSGNAWSKTMDVAPGTYQWGVSDQSENWLLTGPNLEFSVSAQGEISGQTNYTIEATISGSVLVMDRWIAFISETNVNSVAGTTFHGSNLGTFNETVPLTLKGGSLKSYKTGDYDVTGVTMYYRVYKSSETPGDFTSISLPWKENLTDEGQQIWEDIAQTITISQGLSNGSYSLETYFALHYKIGVQTTVLTLTDDNSGASYKANFAFESNVGISDNEAELSSLRFYPNPAVDYLTIDLPEYVREWTITIYNGQGQTMGGPYRGYRVDVSGLVCGVYYVELRTERFVLRQKILIL